MTTIGRIRGQLKDNQIYCGRAGRGQLGFWGNPEFLKSEDDRLNNIERFHHRLFFGDLQNRLANLDELIDKELLCFCRPAACHCDVYADICNQIN